jgi:putative transposase
MDGATTKGPLGGEATGANPTDRGKGGTKRSLLTDADGIPLGIAVAGANRHDSKLLEDTFEAVPIDLPEPDAESKQHLCLDKGYDYDFIREVVEVWAYTPHIRSRGEEKQAKENNPAYKARRWVVERTHAWFNKFRRILVRWEKKKENYVALLHLAAFLIIFNKLSLFG